MARNPALERLPSALKRAMATGRSRHEAHADICRAIDEGKVRFQLSVWFTDDDKLSGLHSGIASRLREELQSGKNPTAARGLLEQQLLYPLMRPTVNPTDIPSPLSSRALDWRKSSFKEPWTLRKTSITSPTRCHVGIELFRDDVGKILRRSAVRDETAAIEALAAHLKKDPDLRREDAVAWCRAQNFIISVRGFQSRVWPRARIEAGLGSLAPSGRKRKSMHLKS